MPAWTPWELRVNVEQGELIEKIVPVDQVYDTDRWYSEVEKIINKIIPQSFKDEGFRVAVKADQDEPTFYQLIPQSIGYTQETE